MRFHDLRSFITDLEKAGELVRISAELSPRYEVAAAIRSAGHKLGKAVLLEKVQGYDIPIIGNLLGNKRRLSIALGVSEEDMPAIYLEGRNKPIKPKLIASAPVQEKIIDHDIDIRCFKEDIPDEMMSRLVSRLYDVGWRTFQQNYGERRQLLCLSKDNVLLDLKFCESNKDYLWYYVWDESPNSSISPNSEATVHCFPIKFFKKLGHLDFMGNGYPVPEPTIEYLEYHYGQRWKEFKCNPKDVDITDTKWDAQHSPPCAMSQEQLAQLLSPSDKRVLSGTRQISKQK